MGHILILGAGTAGTMVANKLRRRLDSRHWQITLVDREEMHDYQPGYLFVPFGRYKAAELTRHEKELLDDGVEFVVGEVDWVDTATNKVVLTDGRTLRYDDLVIATGTAPRPDQTPGMLGPLWRQRIFDFYTWSGATALRDTLSTFASGRLVVHIAEMPIKCPVAPLEFAFLADAWFRERGLRHDIEITYVTPLSGAFTKPVASAYLGTMLEARGIAVEPDFMVESIDSEQRMLVSYDGRAVPFDLLVTVPVNMGADFVARSGLGDELNYVPVDRHTLQSRQQENVFAIGDAADLPTSKAGSVVHFSADTFVRNFVDHLHRRPMRESFDGHANCFVESGGGKALLIDFNYDIQPLPGSYPFPVVGPLRLLKETRLNHLGKLAFNWLYWHVLLPGRSVPLPARMSMLGKHRETTKG